jgi:hypothetical protein
VAPRAEPASPPTEEELLQARQRATQALLEAEREEASARRARRRAAARMKHYEHLLAIHNGQVPLPFNSTEGEPHQTPNLRI